MKNILWLDLETYSETPIKNGTHAYAENVEIMLFAWAIDRDPVQVWDVTANAKIPLELRLALKNPDVLIYAHNSLFDRTVLNHAMPGVAAGGVERWRDTMARALMLVPFYRHSLKVFTDSQNLCLLFGLFNFARIAPCRYASSRFTLASANDTSGYTPSAKSFSLPATQYFNRQ